MIHQVKCLECKNTKCSIQRYCSEISTQVAELSKSQSLYKTGQYIFTEGSPVRGIYFIYKGKVKVVTAGIQNREQIVRLASEGHILGHRGYGGEIYPIGAVALQDTTVCFMDNATLKELFDKNPNFTYAMMMFYSQELRKVEKRIKYVSQMTVSERVVESLLYYINTFGYEKGSGLMNLGLPRKDISALAGTNADQVSRALSELKRMGVLETKGKRIYILNPEKLREIVSDFDIAL